MTTPNDGRRNATCELTRDASIHAGLLLDKYLSAQRLPGPEKSEETGTAIRALLVEAAGTHVPEGYPVALERRRALLEAFDGGVEGGVTRLFTAEARGWIVVGLGTQSVRETNVALQHTWGVPFLPGSALKGLASAAAHRLAGDATWEKAREEQKQGEDHALLFGDTTSAGVVVFHDAWWMPAPSDKTLPLDLDVMTVHHADYYRDGKSAPADWDEPNPVAFLTARGKYQVALSGPEAWVLRAGEWLKAGLDELGLGAKTQAGYGRMSLSLALTQREIEQTAQQQKHKARLATLAGLPAQHKGAGTAQLHIQRLREAIAEGAPAAAVHEIALDLFKRDPGFWRKWAVEERRTPEEKRFMSESGMLHEGPAGRSR